MPESIHDLLGRLYSVLPMGMRYGKTYRETLDLLKRSREWDDGQMEAFRIAELRKLLGHCLANVPFHAERIRKAGIAPRDIGKISDLESLPLLDKDQILANQDGLKARNLPDADFIPTTTGGSSGMPLKFFQQKGFSWERELAFIATLWERIGFRYGRDARLVLRGAIVDRPGGIRYKAHTREYLCSTYDTGDKHLAGYLDLLRREKIRFIHGHVSSIAIFAQYVLSTGAQVPLQGVLGGSEKAYPFQRELVKAAFGCRLFTWYGQSEQVALAGECEHSERYHIFPEYGILELVDQVGKPIRGPGRIGEIVGTGFNNYAMPLLRYRTGDMASFAEDFCTGCGRRHRLLERIEGRNYEYVVTRSGNLVSLTGLIFGQHFRAFGNLAKMQVYQDAPGRIEIRMVPGPGYEAGAVEEEIRGKISAAVGTEIEVALVETAFIPLSETGKHMFLIQKLRTLDGGKPFPERGA